MMLNESLDQYFVPAWAAERIVANYYPCLTNQDTVFDVGCGDGRILMAIPKHVKAYGFEIDPVLAQAAHDNTGREVIQECTGWQENVIAKILDSIRNHKIIIYPIYLLYI